MPDIQAGDLVRVDKDYGSTVQPPGSATKMWRGVWLLTGKAGWAGFISKGKYTNLMIPLTSLEKV